MNIHFLHRLLFVASVFLIYPLHAAPKKKKTPFVPQTSVQEPASPPQHKAQPQTPTSSFVGQTPAESDTASDVQPAQETIEQAIAQLKDALASSIMEQRQRTDSNESGEFVDAEQELDKLTKVYDADWALDEWPQADDAHPDAPSHTPLQKSDPAPSMFSELAASFSDSVAARLNPTVVSAFATVGSALATGAQVAADYATKAASNLWQDAVGRNHHLYEEIISGNFNPQLTLPEDRTAVIHRVQYALADAIATKNWHHACTFLQACQETKLQLSTQTYRNAYLFLKKAAQATQESMAQSARSLHKAIQTTQAVLLQLKSAQANTETAAHLAPTLLHDAPCNYSCCAFILAQRAPSDIKATLSQVISTMPAACTATTHIIPSVPTNIELPEVHQTTTPQVPSSAASSSASSFLERTSKNAQRAVQVGVGKLRNKVVGYTWIYERIEHAKKGQDREYWLDTDDAETKARKTSDLEWAMVEAVKGKKIKQLVTYIEEATSKKIDINLDLMKIVHTFLENSAEEYAKALIRPVHSFKEQFNKHKNTLITLKKARKQATAEGHLVADEDDLSGDEQYTDRYVYEQKMPQEERLLLWQLMSCTSEKAKK